MFTALLFYFGYINLGFQIPKGVIYLLLFFAWVFILYFGKSEKVKDNNKQKSFLRFFTIALFRIIVAAILFRLIYVLFFSYFHLNIQQNFLSTFLAVAIFLLLLFIISFYVRGTQPIPIWNTMTNLSKPMWILLGIGVVTIFCVYLFAQCREFSLPIGLTCVYKIFGK